MTWRTALRAASSSGSAAPGWDARSGLDTGLCGLVHRLRIVLVDEGAHRLLGSQDDPLLVAPHVDGLPRAVAGAELAADAALEVHLHQLHEIGVLGAGDDLDAVHRAEGDAGLAAGAAGLVDHRELLRRLGARRFVDLDLLRIGKSLGHASDLR